MPTPPRKKKPSFNPPPASPGSTGWVPKPKTESRAAQPEVIDAPSPPPPGAAADQARALAVVKRYAFYAAGAGLVPLPAVDMAAIAIIELRMVQELAAVYNVPFSNDRARPIIASLIGGYASTQLGYGAGGSLLKAVPLIGPALAALSVPGFAAGLTWAIGRAFIVQFQSGGTLMTLDLDRMKRVVTRS